MDFRKLMALGLVTLVAGACGSDGPGEPTGDTLSENEIEELGEVVFEEVLGEAFGAAFGGGFAFRREGPQASAPPIDFDVSQSETVSCDGGGTVTVQVDVDGTIDSDTGEGNFSFDVTSDPNNCVVDTDDLSFTINGDPNIRLTGDFEFGAQGTPVGTQTLEYVGGFSWESSDGRSGSCPVDVQINFSQTSVSTSGQVCGRSYTANISINA